MKQSRIVLMLGTAAALLLGLNAYLVATPVDISPLQAGGSTALESERMLPNESSGHGDLSQTTSRPLFASDRRPVAMANAVPEDVAKAPVSAPEHLELRGVMRRGGRMQALIRSGNDLAGHWIPVGGAYEGLHLRDIKGDVAIIEARGERYELPMTYRRVENSSETSPPPQ